MINPICPLCKFSLEYDEAASNDVNNSGPVNSEGKRVHQSCYDMAEDEDLDEFKFKGIPVDG